MSRPSGTNLALGAWTTLVFLFLFAPIIVIGIYSFNGGRLLTAWDGFSLEPFKAIIERPTVRHTVAVSLQTAVIAALLACALGTLAGMATARFPGRWAGPFTLLLLLVSVTPEIVDGIALLPWFVTLGQDWSLLPFNNGYVRLVIGHSLFATAVVTYIVRARLVGLDASLEEASADLYARPVTTFFKVTLPLVGPAVLAGGLLAFTLSLDNTVISSFINVSGTTSWPVYVLSSVRSGLKPEIAAVSTILLVLTLLVLGLVALVLKRSGSSVTDTMAVN
ncbi:spermidine/putrescine transport system permease protein/spermidine/putrescine transport system permease protein/putrescine transport system permease protein [Nocardioides sp. YR527]|uniref:ABC transporter permease n=1 Tax=Nocardioides sp. YR527 TaxID=1881028 RepID=UPI00088E872C|nr:ABC transporter permease [Nocardioides sp. YR527]SDL16380.1 spermidine/putrescine transport system permease protein/spermidine/putrescine transport system permease protein/putrescine transport system permease protein [Nocardioides sp. YR527]